MKPVRRLAAALLLLALAGCSNDEPADDTPTTAASTSSSASGSPTPSKASSTPSSSPTPTPSPSEPTGPQLVVTIRGEKITPNSEEFDLNVGETLTIRFETDRAGELHVHSTPEQFVEFDAGSSVKELVIDAPGVVEVEEHDTSHVVASLEVR